MIGDKIKQYRKTKGLSQLELELIINASPGSLSRIENNLVNPTKETLCKLAKALNLNPAEISELLGLKIKETDQLIPSYLLEQEIVDGLSLKDIVNCDYSEYAFLKGKDYFIRECDSILDNNEKEVLYIENINSWRQVYTEEIGNAYHIPKRIKRKKFAKYLLNNSELARSFKEKDHSTFRESRIIPNHKDFEYSLMINENQITVFFIDPNASAFTIQSNEIARKARTLFNTIWETSKSN